MRVFCQVFKAVFGDQHLILQLDREITAFGLNQCLHAQHHACLKRVVIGAGDRVVVSHDSVWCWRGAPVPDPAVFEAMSQVWNPLHFSRRIAPMLREGGATEEQIEALLVDNPRRYFTGETLASIA